MNTDTSKKTFLLVEGALMIAMAFVLSYIKLYDMPMGGSITLEMIPLVIMGLRHGVKWGTFTAAVHGIIQLILGFSNVMYCATIPAMIGCVLLDYLFAFTVLGLAGLFLPLFKNKPYRCGSWNGDMRSTALSVQLFIRMAFVGKLCTKGLERCLL